MNNRLLYMCIPQQRIGFVQSMDLFGSGHLLILSSNENTFSYTASPLVHYKQKMYLKISLQPTERARAESLATQTSKHSKIFKSNSSLLMQTLLLRAGVQNCFITTFFLFQTKKKKKSGSWSRSFLLHLKMFYKVLCRL